MAQEKNIRIQNMFWICFRPKSLSRKVSMKPCPWAPGIEQPVIVWVAVRGEDTNILTNLAPVDLACHFWSPAPRPPEGLRLGLGRKNHVNARLDFNFLLKILSQLPERLRCFRHWLAHSSVKFLEILYHPGSFADGYFALHDQRLLETPTIQGGHTPFQRCCS